MRLLIVEDDRQLREALTDLLRQSGFEVDAFAEGDQAFNALLSRDYDLAIVDLGLPGMDGLVLVRSLRRHLRGLPILVVTARDALEDRVSGLDAGADDYLVKPFERAAATPPRGSQCADPNRRTGADSGRAARHAGWGRRRFAGK
jgi:DNA-binding response OmpR family regulator